MPTGQDKEYLGDGVYAEWTESHIILSTFNGVNSTNTIFLDSQTLEEFLEYISRLKERTT